MAKIIDHKYSINDAFRQCFYIVPDYQREYVWTDKEVQRLLEDINEQIDGDSNREYFIGTVLVSPTQDRDHFEVIDGQQRLTTFFLLLCVLKHLFRGEKQHQTIGSLIITSYPDSDGETCTSLKLEPRYENAGEVMAKIVELDAEPQAVRSAMKTAGFASFGSLENIINAYDTLYRYLKDNYDDNTELKKYWGYLANSVVFIQISTDVSSALKIFETINERGIGLNPMDLLKNLLFRHVRQDQFSQLKDEWKKITKPLEKEKEKPLRFLRYFLMANYPVQNKRKDSMIREDEIYDWFTNKNNIPLCDYVNKPFEFVRKVIRNVEHYLAFATGQGNDGKPSIAMDSLKRLCGGAFSLHYILLLSVSNFPKPLFDHFVSQLESFLFYYIFTKSPTKELERKFSLWADQLRNIGTTNDLMEQKKKLNFFVVDRFQKNMTAKEPELNDALKRYSLYTMQQYRARYLLAKLTQHVDMAYKGLKKPGSLGDYTALEIEHILPNNPTTELRDRFTSENPGTDYDGCKNMLGNLTLLEKPINIVAGRNYFSAKLAEYKKCKYYLTSSIAELTTVGQNTSINRINEKLESFDEWSSVSIDKRRSVLIGLSREVWKTTALPIE